MINITKTFLPPLEEYQEYIRQIWQSDQLTNQGPLLKQLEKKLTDFLKVDHIQFVSNGTIALQLALDAINIKDGEIITTPFSYVATTSSILWERCKPVFVDIETNNFTIDADKIEQAITPKTKAIMAVHVFGYACNIEKIEKIAQKHNLKVIYDGAHSFAAKYKGKSIFKYGDISTCSFHATKLFHTVEGGACICNNKEINDKLDLAKRFGHNYEEYIQLGINAKNSELHAAMGLANFPYIGKIIAERKELSELYDHLLGGCVGRPKNQEGLEYNYAYYPVLFKSEEQLLKVFKALRDESIFPRRYFYPSLNKLSYVNGESCPNSEDISQRIACLPLYLGLEKETVEKIAEIINEKTNFTSTQLLSKTN